MYCGIGGDWIVGVVGDSEICAKEIQEMKSLLKLYFIPRLATRLLALILTVGLECAVAWLLKFRKKEELWAVVCVNVVTNPILNYLLWVLPHLSDWIWGLESLVVLVEWGLLCFALKGDVWKLLRLSFVMNVVSAVLGLAILNGVTTLFKMLVVMWS